MSVFNLEKMLAPQSVAVVGASEKPESVGTAVMNNLITGGFTGQIYPVNPNYRQILGHPAFYSVDDLPCIDLVVLATPIHTAPEIVRKCAEKGCGGAVILSAGGKETGSKGAAIEAQIHETVCGGGFRVIGPNCLGVISTRSNLNASFARCMPARGKMAFISQSGAICTAILDFAVKENIGFSYFISLGSMLDADFGDMIDYLGNDAGVSGIVMYVEGLSRIRNFMSAARAVSRVKPIIALKAGRTAAGAAAAASHTGALAGEDAIYDAAFKRAGIIRVKTFAELFDCAEFIGKQPRPRGNGLAIVTNAGGPGVMAADALHDYGIAPVNLSPETLDQLDAVLPGHWSRGNPVDILGDASAERYRDTVEILMRAREVDGLLVMLAPQAMTNPTQVAQTLVAQLREKPFPVFTSWLGGKDVEAGRGIFNQAGIPTFDSPERAVRAFTDLYQYTCNLETLQQIPGRLPDPVEPDHNTVRSLIDAGLLRPGGLLSEIEAKQLMAAYGIPVNATEPAGSADQAVQIAERIGYPVAMKVNSTLIVHKSDVGGVVLGIRDAGEVRKAFDDIKTRVEARFPGAFEGVSVQEMIPGGDYELIAGAKKDRDFGPVLMFGTGGILTEVFKDRSLALPPINRILARQMIEETRIYRVLNGYRNHRALDMLRLETLLIRLSRMVADFSEITEIDLNPLRVQQGLVVAVDARVIVGPASVAAPLHLVISPYPRQYERECAIDGVGMVLIRPIQPEDAPLLEDLFAALSPRSIYYRFFGPMKRLPKEMLARFTQIDYDREIAMVAIARGDGNEKMLGVGRIIAQNVPKEAEFSVVVADSYHGKGVGAALLKSCLSIARGREIENIRGRVLPGNTGMLALGRKLGFSVRLDPVSKEYELALDLSSTGQGQNRTKVYQYHP